MPNEIAIDLNSLGGKSLFPRGRKSSGPPEFRISRELTALDISERMVASVDSVPAPLQRLRDSHHAVARMMADGQSNVYISGVSGYSTQTVSQLRSDPAFQELLTYYQIQKEEIFVDVTVRLKNVALDAVTTLTDRIADNPDSIAAKDLISLAQLGADRSGFGPTSTQLSMTATISAERMKEIKESAHQKQGVRILDAKTSPTKTPSDEERPQGDPIPDKG